MVLVAAALSVIEVEPLGPDNTRVTTLGYRANTAYDPLFDFFTRANDARLRQLGQRFECGLIDSSAPRAR
jgi:hypothetical protein